MRIENLSASGGIASNKAPINQIMLSPIDSSQRYIHLFSK